MMLSNKFSVPNKFGVQSNTFSVLNKIIGKGGVILWSMY